LPLSLSNLLRNVTWSSTDIVGDCAVLGSYFTFVLNLGRTSRYGTSYKRSEV